MFEIEKGKPMPTTGGIKLYPFGNMKVGDSFLVPLNGKDHFRLANSIRDAARGGRWKDKRFTVRYIKEEDGLRCWRIK